MARRTTPSRRLIITRTLRLNLILRESRPTEVKLSRFAATSCGGDNRSAAAATR
jgi:hypothetical protein